MELMWLVYGISVLNELGMLAGIILLIGGICGTILLIASYMDDDFSFPRPKTVVAILVISLATTVVVPSERTMYTMAAAYATQKVAEAPATKEVADKVLKIINEKLDAMVKK